MKLINDPMKNHLRMLAAFFAVVMLFSLSGCALIFSGTTTHVHVEGNPDGAKVYYNGSYVGTAPCEVKISKKDLQKGKAVITIKQDGYNDATIVVSGKVKVAAIIGDVLTGLVGLAVDFATGAVYKPMNDNIKYSLEKSIANNPDEKIHAVSVEFMAPGPVPAIKATIDQREDFVTVNIHPTIK